MDKNLSVYLSICLSTYLLLCIINTNSTGKQKCLSDTRPLSYQFIYGSLWFMGFFGYY